MHVVERAGLTQEMLCKQVDGDFKFLKKRIGSALLCAKSNFVCVKMNVKNKITDYEMTIGTLKG